MKERRSSDVQGWRAVCWLLHTAPRSKCWLSERWRRLHLNISVEGRHPVSCGSSHVNGRYCGVWIPSFSWLRLFLGFRLSPPVSAGSLAGARCTWGQKQLQWERKVTHTSSWSYCPTRVAVWTNCPALWLLPLAQFIILLQDDRDWRGQLQTRLFYYSHKVWQRRMRGWNTAGTIIRVPLTECLLCPGHCA